MEFFQLIYYLYQEAYYALAINSKLKVALEHHSKYYRKLRFDKSEFRRKVWDFIRYNEFVVRGDVKLRFSVKVIIASHAVQLSCNLPEECYDYYEKIILYKDYYRSRFTGKLHKGEVNPAMRLIVFSIRAIYESTNREDDGLNVLLHEFAHALWLEHLLKQEEYTIFDEHHFNQLRQFINEELQQAEQNRLHFFRNYAFANEAEFFAVAVENFFERAAQFQQELPELYGMLTRLFKQSPAN